MREIVTQVEVSGGQAFIGESQAEGNAPYAAFAQIILRALRAHQKDELDLTNLVIAELISITPELQVYFPDIPQNPALDPESEQRRLFECIYRFFGALCSEKPTLLVLEDIHWADSGTLSLFSFLAQRCLNHPVMLLSTYREVELDEALSFYQTLLDLKRKNLGKRLKLERLGEEKTRDLLTVIFNTNQITQEFLDGIYKETEGNPFFIEEVCKTLIEKGQVYFDGERWRRKPDMSDMEIPQSIKIAVQSRISKLNESTQDILRNAAVIGREFSFKLLQKVTQFEEDKLINCLEDAIKSKLIEELKKEGEERFSFIHALIQTALQDSLSGMRKTRLHRRVAQVIEEVIPDAFQRLAYHWSKGGNEEKALDYTIKAAVEAKQRFANADAIRLFGKALEFLSENDDRRFDLLKARAEIYNMTGDRISQRAEIEAMLMVSEMHADKAMQIDSLHAVAELYLEIDVKKALEPAESAYKISQKIDDLPRLAKSAHLIGIYHFRYYEFHQSLRYYVEAVQIARKAGLKYELLEYLRYLAGAQSNIGQKEAKIATALETVDLCNELNDPRSIVIGKRLLAMAYHAKGRFEEGLSLCQTAVKIAREIGDIEQEFNNLNILAWNLDGLGRWEEEEKIYLRMIQDFNIFDFHRVIVVLNNLVSLYETLGEYEKNHVLVSSLMEKARQSGNENIQFFLSVHYDASCSLFGMYQEGREELENIWPCVDKSMNQISKSYILSRLGVSSGLAGDLKAAAYYIEQSQILNEECEDSTNKGDVWVNCAHTSLIAGQPEVLKEGLDQITCSLGTLFRLGPVDNWFAYCVKAGIHLALLSEDTSHAGEALVAIEEALKIFKGYPVGWGTFELLFYTASQAYRANGLLEEAGTYLRKAYKRIMLIAGKIQDDDLRKSFLENVAENRAILKEAEAQGWAAELLE
jgi:tetratricopeptide (TPR) repeat protein